MISLIDEQDCLGKTIKDIAYTSQFLVLHFEDGSAAAFEAHKEWEDECEVLALNGGAPHHILGLGDAIAANLLTETEAEEITAQQRAERKTLDRQKLIRDIKRLKSIDPDLLRKIANEE